MNATKILLLISLSVFCTNIFSQNNTITKGNKTRTLDKEKYYEISAMTIEEEGCDDCFSTMIEGEIQRFTKDSIQMKLRNFRSIAIIDNARLTNQIYSKNTSNVYTFPKSDIYSLSYYKNEKSKKRKKRASTFGGVLVVTGIVTGLNALYVKGNSNKKVLGYSGLGQLLGGIVAISVFRPSKTYYFKSRKGKELWEFK